MLEAHTATAARPAASALVAPGGLLILSTINRTPKARALAITGADAIPAIADAGTYNGNPLMTAVGAAVLDALLAPGFLQGVAARGDQLAAGLASLARKRGLGEVRGRGLLWALAGLLLALACGLVAMPGAATAEDLEEL